MKVKSIQIICMTTLLVHSMAVQGQAYPSKPIKMLVGFSAGGGTDITARMVANKLSGDLNQTVIVENRPGAGGMIATEAVARSNADGYTLLMVAAAEAVQPAIRQNLTYDLVKDFSPISLIVTVPFALVTHPSVPAKSAKDLISLAKAHPGKLNYASSGVGSSAHLSNELFNSMANIQITHVPYKGVSQGVTALASGQVDMIFASFPAALPLLNAKKIKALGVSTLTRSSVMPDLPTVDESGLKGYERYGWYGLIAPAGVPTNIITRLHQGIVRTVSAPEMKSSFINQGLEPLTNTPGEFAVFIKKEIAQTATLMKSTQAKAN